MGGANVLKFYQENEWQNYHFAYINSKKNFIINNSDLLFEGQSTTMFAQNKTFIIHLKNQTCFQTTSTTSACSLEDSINKFLISNYPKQKFLSLAFQPMIEQNFINDNFYFKPPHEKIHIIDFIRWLNNKFDKNDKPPPQLKALIKQLQLKNIRLPGACVHNPLAKQLLC